MNFKTALSTISFCLLLGSKMFSQIAIEDLSAIIPSTTCINTVSMPSTITVNNEYATLWAILGTCNNGMGVNGTLTYNVLISPKFSTTPQLPLYARAFSITKSKLISTNLSGGPNPITVNNSLNQATFGNIFTLTWAANDFKIKFLDNKMLAKYNVTVTKCCKVPFNSFPPTLKVSSYPNPANNEVNIKYDMPEKSNVSILVFDKYNRLVKQVIKNEKQDAGEQFVQFDTYDLNDGIYYVRLQTGKDVVVKTIVVSKEMNY